MVGKVCHFSNPTEIRCHCQFANSPVYVGDWQIGENLRKKTIESMNTYRFVFEKNKMGGSTKHVCPSCGPYLL